MLHFAVFHVCFHNCIYLCGDDIEFETGTDQFERTLKVASEMEKFHHILGETNETITVLFGFFSFPPG